MTTFVVAHGAWSAGWAWKKMRPLLRAHGHELVTPTYTGIGERSHLATPAVNLSTHVADILGVLEFEDLHDIVLVGHSYGGMVATMVADRVSARIAHLVYLDAFVPRDGQALVDLVGPEPAAGMRAGALAKGEGWRVPPNPLPPDTGADDVAWALPRRVMQPLASFEERVSLTGALERLARTYIYCTRSGPGDVFAQFARRARGEAGWNYRQIDASHNPHITKPEVLAGLLDETAGFARQSL